MPWERREPVQVAKGKTMLRTCAWMVLSSGLVATMLPMLLLSGAAYADAAEGKEGGERLSENFAEAATNAAALDAEWMIQELGTRYSQNEKLSEPFAKSVFFQFVGALGIENGLLSVRKFEVPEEFDRSKLENTVEQINRHIENSGAYLMTEADLWQVQSESV